LNNPKNLKNGFFATFFPACCSWKKVAGGTCSHPLQSFINLWINFETFNVIIYFSALCLTNRNNLQNILFRHLVVPFQIADKYFEGRKSPNRAETVVTVPRIAT
jgi:hypothetical protein